MPLDAMGCLHLQGICWKLWVGDPCAFHELNTDLQGKSAVATSSANGMMSASDKIKLDGIAAKANNYSHPASHPANMITQDAAHRFVADTEKNSWNGKAAGNHSHSYLPLSGGTLSGALNANAGIRVPAGYSFEARASNGTTAYRQGGIDCSGEFQIKSATGNPGIFTNGALYMIKYNGSGWSPVYASAFSVQSTKCSKENFSGITEGEASALLGITPWHFDYINGEKGQSGFIAEDVAPLFPGVCSYQVNSRTGERELFGIDYSKFAPYIVKLLQMQEERIAHLEKQLRQPGS